MKYLGLQIRKKKKKDENTGTVDYIVH